MKYDLSQYAGPIRDQLSLGACMAFAITNCVTQVTNIAGRPVPMLSALGLYNRTLIEQGTPTVDYGSIPSEAFDVARKIGIGTEAAWPYVPGNLFVTPPSDVILKVDGVNVGNIYQNTSMLVQNFKLLLSQGKPIILVFDVYSYFMRQDGPIEDQVRIDARGTPIGVHAVVMDTIDDLYAYYGVQNQWGTVWGDEGRGSIAYKEFTPDSTNYYSTGLRNFYTIDKVGGLDLTWSAPRLDVARDYALLLGRAPDLDGMNWWASLGLSDLQLAEYLIASAEGQALYGNDTSAEFVIDMYREVVGRAADAGGLAFWSGQLDAGNVTRAQVYMSMYASAEAAALVANKSNLSAYMAITMQSDGSVDTAGWIDMVTGDAQATEIIKVGIPDLNG